MSDLIDRQQAIDAINILYAEHRYKIPGRRETYSQYNEAWQDALSRAEGEIFQLPSAEPQIIACGEGELSTNLAEVGTDCIRRRAAVIQLSHNKIGDDDCDVIIQRDIETIKQLPSAEPDIIYCKDCRKHNKLLGDYESGHWIFKTEACPLVGFRGKAQGHEFDYQFCAFGKRRTE